LADASEKTGKFTGDGYANLVVLHAARFQLPIAVTQTQLRTPGDRSDVGRLLLLTLLQRHRDARREAVVPGRLDQHPAHVGIAGLGNCPEPTLLTGPAPDSPSIHPHLFRHAAGYKLDGHDTRAIQQYLGHKNRIHPKDRSMPSVHRPPSYRQKGSVLLVVLE
jgi:hypothetical protein